MDYIYAVARIRTKEMKLFGSSVIEQLISASDYNECMNILFEKGWGNGEGTNDAQAMLKAEVDKTWLLMSEMVEDMSKFDVFLYGNDYHNLKTALKMKYSGSDIPTAYMSYGTIEPAVIKKAVFDNEPELLEEKMQEVLSKASEVLFASNEPQLCDIIIDRAALEAIYEASKETGEAVLIYYGELTVAMANIKTAARASKAGKSHKFILDALCPCDSLDVNMLALAASQSIEEIDNYLQSTDYSVVGEALKEGVSKCEKILDDLLIEKIKPQKYVIDGIGPLASYVLARFNEIKNVRFILSGKENKLEDAFIRERMRQMYV